MVVSLSENVLELEDVWKVYRLGAVEVPALRGISFQVKRGELVAITGASGSGKSTVLNMMGVLDAPTRGRVFLDGTDVTAFGESRLARVRGKKIGFVFQTFNLYPTLNVIENISLPMRIHEFKREKIKKRSRELARLVGLSHREKHLPAQLSGGERQRVAIARALSTEPAMILADEPTGNLDSKSSREIINLLLGLQRKENKTVVIVTHEPNIASLAERIITLKDGKIATDKKNKRGELEKFKQ